jgi:6-pyruvoyltetrahydropterin/6-carboxytetrahydropterin synthase
VSQAIAVFHNAEAAHRLYTTPGKCENIHGHSFGILLQMFGPVDEHGMVCGLDFADVKKAFRQHIDTWYDHHVLLNQDDPWARPLDSESWVEAQVLPGVMPVDGDPTTENIARWIGEWCVGEFKIHGITSITLTVQETAVNAASWDWDVETA